MKPMELIYTPCRRTGTGSGAGGDGYLLLHVKEKAGTRIHIQTGEGAAGGNFYRDNLRSAKSEYWYVSDGKERELIPHFTFFGYRYAEDLRYHKSEKEDFTALVLYSEIEDKGTIETGNDLVNQLVSNVRWGMKDNFLDVPTDCPQRDERMGWTGMPRYSHLRPLIWQIPMLLPEISIYDMATEQQMYDGMVPDVIPSCGVESSACVWGDAATLIPWNLYQFYGDRSILEGSV